jgi:predicted alpha/beta-fold hydrolase
MTTFTPKRGLRNAHVMTVYTWGRPRRFPRLPAPSDRLFDVAPETQILAHCHWQAQPAQHPALVALHGLEGSSTAHYMRGLADKAFAAGFNVVLLNQRNCGGTECLAAGLYHSGLTADADHVIRELADADGVQEVIVAGYSLGGNLALKLAGELGCADLPEVKAVAAVSPVIELDACMRAIERRANRIYEWNFCRNLQGRMRRKARAAPDLFDLSGLWKVWSIRQFDDRYTAPNHGFEGASDYYHRASAMRVIERIARPALIVTAADDPFVPPEIFRAPAVVNNPHIRTLVTSHGGHCGFVADANGYDGYWAEQTVIEFLVAQAGTGIRDQGSGIRDQGSGIGDR